MVKKRVAPRKAARKKAPQKAGADKRGVGSRLDLKPLQRHISKRIEELENKRGAAGLALAGGP